MDRGRRAEELVGRLVQLGAARLVPVRFERASAEARGAGEGRRTRLERIALEALKQSGRAWPLEIGQEQGLEGLLTGAAGAAGAVGSAEAERLVLDPAAPLRLSAWLAARRARSPCAWTRAAPLCVVVGPEGGLTAEEGARLGASGATPVALGPYVLRIETAAEAAVAVLAEALHRVPQNDIRSRSETQA